MSQLGQDAKIDINFFKNNLKKKNKEKQAITPCIPNYIYQNLIQFILNLIFYNI